MNLQLQNTMALVAELNECHLELIRLQEVHNKKNEKLQALGLGKTAPSALLDLGSSTQKIHESCLRERIARITKDYKQSVVVLMPSTQKEEALKLATHLYNSAAKASTCALQAGYKNKSKNINELLNDVQDIFLEAFQSNLSDLLTLLILLI